MFDIQLRSLKDRIFDPCCRYVSPNISPLHITAAAFTSGLVACYLASVSLISASLLFWLLNRALDCLDGAVARHRKMASDLGGFLDLLGDFIIYSLLPIAIAASQESSVRCWQVIAFLEASFHVNNFILFYVAAILEKKQRVGDAKSKELTSVIMRPALVEGMESGLLFTAMLVLPTYIEPWSWLMAGLVSVGIVQRTLWVIAALR